MLNSTLQKLQLKVVARLLKTRDNRGGDSTVKLLAEIYNNDYNEDDTVILLKTTLGQGSKHPLSRYDKDFQRSSKKLCFEACTTIGKKQQH